MEFLTVKAQYLYAQHSSVYKQEERYNLAISFETQFAEKYPASKYMAAAVSLKKDSETGVVKAKRTITEYANELKYMRRFEKKDTVTGQPPSEKVDVNKKIPN